MSAKTNMGIKLSEWIESFIITIIFIIISKLFHDPLSLNSPYPWIWFAPVSIALHYGLLPSQFSIGILLFEALYKDPTPLDTIHFQLFILGGFSLTIICAAWQSSWSKKITSSNEISNYLQNRIQTIANAYKLTSLAYKRLENNYIAKPVTIRTSLNDIRIMQANVNELSQKDIFKRLMSILTINCSFEKAAIFPLKNNQVIPKPIVSIGSIKLPSRNSFFITPIQK